MGEQAKPPKTRLAFESRRQVGCAGCQPSSRFALALETPRSSVIMTTPVSPANIRPTNRGTRMGFLAPISRAKAGSHSATHSRRDLLGVECVGHDRYGALLAQHRLLRLAARHAVNLVACGDEPRHELLADADRWSG